MNGVIGMTRLTLDTDLTGEQREYLNTVSKSANSLLNIIDDILDFSKIEAGMLDFEISAFSISDMLADAMELLAPHAHEKGLELAYGLNPDVPDALLGDPLRLRQVIMNLANNAIKFTEQGEVVVETNVESQVVVEAKVDSQDAEQVSLHFSVKDTGIGIPTEKQRSIFFAFSQADGSTTRRFGGTGLGLAVCSRLVELMGGRIWVESEIGLGSTFHFTAKFGLGEAAAVRPRKSELATLGGLRVLVVDDNATNRSILEAMLTNWNMSPVLAESGQVALTVLQQAQSSGQPFPLIITDMNMPEMDGLELVEKIRHEAVYGDSEIIMLTSGNTRGDVDRYTELGIGSRLTKPVRQSDLLDAITKILGQASTDSDPESRSTRQPSEPSGQGLDILLAEDNAVNQMLVIRLLEQQGHRVTLAVDGKEAISKVEQERFDLVLMDVQMPEMDGLEATRVIREKEGVLGTHIPIMAMTANAMTGDRELCFEAGMDFYISKPIDPQELFVLIEETVAQREPVQDRDTPVQESSPIMDKDAALARALGNEDLLTELVELFVEDVPTLLEGIRNAIANADPERLGRHSHTLKGSASNLSAGRVTEAALELERIGHSRDVEGAEDAFSVLDSEVGKLLTILTQMLEDENASVNS